MFADCLLKPVNLLSKDLFSVEKITGTTLLHEDDEVLILRCVGPTFRTDFHINSTSEIFFQLKGNMKLKWLNMHKNPPTIEFVEIREHEMYRLPPFVPHQPERPAATVGIVIEKKTTDRSDEFCWIQKHAANQTCRIVKRIPFSFKGCNFSEEVAKYLSANCPDPTE